jgi:leucyl-tRNA synthetase
VWRLATDPEPAEHPTEEAQAGGSAELKRAVHRTIARVTTDIDRYAFNTAVAACMELYNTISRHARSGTDRAVVEESIDTLLELLAPFAPHLAAEAYELRHGDNVHTRPWPVADLRLVTDKTVTMLAQVNGKVKDRIEVPRDISEEAATALTLASPKVQEALGGASPARVIARPPRLVNVVV